MLTCYIIFILTEWNVWFSTNCRAAGEFALVWIFKNDLLEFKFYLQMLASAGEAFAPVQGESAPTNTWRLWFPNSVDKFFSQYMRAYLMICPHAWPDCCFNILNTLILP